MKFRLNEKQLLVMTVALFFVVALPLAILGYFQHKSLGTYAKDVTKLTGEIEQARAKKNQMDQLSEQKKQLEKELKLLQEILPTKEEVSYENFLELLGRLKHEANIELYKAQLVKEATRGPSATEAFEKVSYELQLESGFYELIHFIYLLESYNRFIKIDKFAVQPGKGGEKGGPIRYGLTLTLTTYTFKE